MPHGCLTNEDSFFGGMTDQMSSAQADALSPRAHLVAVPVTPITESQWKEHLAIKGVAEINGVKAYAGELAMEMREYCLIRLENVNNNLNAIMRRLKKLKPKKNGKKRPADGAAKTHVRSVNANRT